MFTLAELKQKQKQKEDKIKEYKLTDEAVRLASIIILDGIVCKDRWDFSTGSYIGESPMNVTNTNLIIGYNGQAQDRLSMERRADHRLAPSAYFGRGFRA